MELWFVVATFQFAKDFQVPFSWTFAPPPLSAAGAFHFSPFILYMLPLF
jgi:hypothetical protein